MDAAPRKTRPILKDIQNAVALQVEESRHYVVLQTDLSPLSPTYPTIDRVQLYPRQAPIVASFPSSPASGSSCSSPQVDHSALHACAPSQIQSLRRSSSLIVSRSLDSQLSVVSDLELANTSWSTAASHWDSSQESHDHIRLDPHPPLFASRSFTPPISPPTVSSSAAYTDYSSKRSGRTFALVPAEADGKRVFSHVVVGQHGICRRFSTSPETDTTIGLPEDMKDTLQQLDDLACWVKAASSSRTCMNAVKEILDTTRLAGQSDLDVPRTEDPTSRPLLNKGKTRLLSDGLSKGRFDSSDDLREPLGGAVPRNLTIRSGDSYFLSEGFIYVPNRNTPEFLVGSSRSPIAYPVHGYSSHPSRYSPCGRLPGSMHDIPYHRRFLYPRSAPRPPANGPLVTPPSVKATFLGFFRRPTTAATPSSVSSSRGPPEGMIRRGKRVQLPWLRI